MKTLVNNYCIPVIGIFIFLGCSTQNKKEELLSVQQRRIMKLERQLKQKEEVINKMKLQRWVGTSSMTSQPKEFHYLEKLIKNKEWLKALSESGSLKKKYPGSVKLSLYRYKIFEGMGLSKQAKQEKINFNKLRAQKGKQKRNATR